MSEFKGAGGIRRIINAFGYSRDGLVAAFRGEAAFRQLVWLNGILIPVALWLPLPLPERALMVAVCLLSLIVELFNSAIEAVVDRVSLERHPLSKNAKDMGSAAQLVGLSMIGLVWGLLLYGHYFS